MTDRYQIIHSDMRRALALMAENSVDAIVCDPPYEIAFMGRSWDRSGIAFDPDTWRACLRVLKPGGHLVAFGATRTSHRITCAIEDAGFEIRDTLQWVFGSGFPKSLDVGKAINKDAGAVREQTGRVLSVTGNRKNGSPSMVASGLGAVNAGAQAHVETAPATDLARTWHGYGTALKPAHEPITLARKPLSGTVARNVAEWGTGGIDVDGCRVGGVPSPSVERRKHAAPKESVGSTGWTTPARPPSYNEQREGEQNGRWPPNIILGDGAGEVIDAMAPKWPSRSARPLNRIYEGYNIYESGLGAHVSLIPPMSGNASEFFPTFCYVPKASRKEREAGLAGAGIEPMTRADVTEREEGSAGIDNPRAGTRQRGEIRNTHPTVKPVAIMQWLVRLVSPPRSYDPVILDPFAGSGSTGIACVREGVRFVGVELDERHAAIARARIDHGIREQPEQDTQPRQIGLFGGDE